MKLIKSTLLIILAPLNASAANLSSLLPNTTGSIESMGGLNYSVYGEANYTYGVNDTESGFQNSLLGSRFATQNSGKPNFSLGIEAGSKYDETKESYKPNITGDMTAGQNGHSVTVGHLNWFTKSIFPSIYKSSLDTNFSQNPIGQLTNDYSWYAGYSLMHKDVDLSITIDEERNFGLTFAKYINDVQYDLHIYDYNEKLGAFVEGTTGLSSNTLVTGGLGTIESKASYSAALTSIFESGFSTFVNIIGHGKFATASFGGDYTLHNVTLFIEGASDFGSSQTNERQNKIATGLKIIF
ncbi:exported hypothetical protein [Vibrio chagasii]|nr:exported hypothetical protein [Vibrio chagasii]